MFRASSYVTSKHSRFTSRAQFFFCSPRRSFRLSSSVLASASARTKCDPRSNQCRTQCRQRRPLPTREFRRAQSSSSPQQQHSLSMGKTLRALSRRANRKRHSRWSYEATTTAQPAPERVAFTHSIIIFAIFFQGGTMGARSLLAERVCTFTTCSTKNAKG